jgi:hypothetical protein
MDEPIEPINNKPVDPDDPESNEPDDLSGDNEVKEAVENASDSSEALKEATKDKNASDDQIQEKVKQVRKTTVDLLKTIAEKSKIKDLDMKTLDALEDTNRYPTYDSLPEETKNSLNKVGNQVIEEYKSSLNQLFKQLGLSSEEIEKIQGGDIESLKKSVEEGEKNGEVKEGFWKKYGKVIKVVLGLGVVSGVLVGIAKGIQADKSGCYHVSWDTNDLHNDKIENCGGLSDSSCNCDSAENGLLKTCKYRSCNDPSADIRSYRWVEVSFWQALSEAVQAPFKIPQELGEGVYDLIKSALKDIPWVLKIIFGIIIVIVIIFVVKWIYSLLSSSNSNSNSNFNSQ